MVEGSSHVKDTLLQETLPSVLLLSIGGTEQELVDLVMTTAAWSLDGRGQMENELSSCKIRKKNIISIL